MVYQSILGHQKILNVYIMSMKKSVKFLPISDPTFKKCAWQLLFAALFFVAPNISSAQTYFQPTIAIENLTEELIDVNDDLETKSSNDFPSYQLAYAKRIVITDIIGHIKLGLSVKDSYQKSIPKAQSENFASHVFYLPDNSGKINLSWVEKEILPLVAQ